MKTRKSDLSDAMIASHLGLAELRLGRHSSTSEDLTGEHDFWVQSIWRARPLPAFDADAFIAVVTCAEPWQPRINPHPGFWQRCKQHLRGQSMPRVVASRKALISLQDEATVVELPYDPVATALREVDLFETYEYESLDGIGYWFDVETWNLRASFSFGNPEVPSLQRLAKAVLAVGHEIAQISGSGPVAEYLKVWSRYAA